MAEGNFEGFINPSEKPALTDTQVAQVESLPKVILRNNRLEEFIGDVHSASVDQAEPKVMTSPKALLRFVRDTASANGVSPWEVTQSIRSNGVEDPDKLKEIDKKYKETIGYVSDIHGGDQDLYDRLAEMAKDAPDAAIFEGDIIGTKSFEDLQRLYYNWLNNHSRNEILKQNPDATDGELLAYGGTKPPEEGFNLKKGFLKLREYELGLAGRTLDEITEQLDQLTDHEVAEEIRRYSKYVHYGHYASNLPVEAKQALADGLEDNAKRILEPIRAMQQKGTKVAIIEGNWDARAPIDFIPEVPTAEPLEPEKRLFRAKEFFEKNGVPFFNSLTTLETDTTLQVLMPFDAITGFANTPQEKIEEIKTAIEWARRDKKSVVIVSHGQPNWRVHNMTVDNPQPTGEHAQVVAGLTKAVSEFRPDEIVYGHIHDVLTDENAMKLDPNTKYALKVTVDGNVELVESSDEFSSDQTVGSHMQFRRTAELKVPRKDTHRKIAGFGGNRQPLKVK
jgi:Icc-related predicted phosphoesterase